MLIAPPGALTLLASGTAGAFLYANQPLLILAAQDAVPQAPAAAARLVLGFGNAAAGLLYIAVGGLQGLVGLAPAMAMTLVLLAPTALLARKGLMATQSAATPTHREADSDDPAKEG